MDSNSTRKSCTSPDVICPICLAEISKKAVAGSCSHSFCFRCLSELSKRKPECPLCKKTFSVIKHTFKSEGDYEEYRIGATLDVTRAGDYGGYNIGAPLDVTRAVHTAIDVAEEVLQLSRASQIPSPPHSASISSSSVEFRRSVYQRNLWVKPTKMVRRRQSSPEFYREHPTQLDRLIPWLTRELSVTTSFDNLEYAGLDIIDWLKEFHIRSYAFKRLVQVYLGVNTDHFVHELYNFATFPLSLQAYDYRSRYSEMETTSDTSLRSNVEFRRPESTSVHRRPLATLTLRRPRRPNYVINVSSEVNDSEDSDMIEIIAASPSNLTDASNLQSTSTGITAGPSSSPPNSLTNKRPAFFRPPYSDSSSSDEDFLPLKKSKISE